MKLAKSTIFRPEKILSLAIGSLLNSSRGSFFSSPMKLGRALLQEGGRALLLVLGGSAKPEVGSFEQQAFGLAGLRPLVRRLERELDGDGTVGGDFSQDGFSPRDKVSRRHDLVD